MIKQINTGAIDLARKPERLTKSVVVLTAKETIEQTKKHLIFLLQAEFEIGNLDDDTILTTVRDSIKIRLGELFDGGDDGSSEEFTRLQGWQQQIRKILETSQEHTRGVFYEDRHFFRTTEESSASKTNNQIFTDPILKNLTSANVMSGSFQYAITMFLGVKAFRQPDGNMKIFRLKDQIERMRSGFQKLGFGDIEYSDKEIEEAMQWAADKAAGEWGAEGSVDSVYIRPFARADVKNFGISGTAMKKHVNIAFEGEYFDYLGKDQKLFMPRGDEVERNEPDPADKLSAQYNRIRKVTDNLDKTKYTGAVLLDKNGNIAEMAANIFFISKEMNSEDRRTIVTPRLGEILPGFTRDSVIEILKGQGYAIEERDITPDELGSFSGCFTTGTASGAKKVVSIDHDHTTYAFDNDYGIVDEIQLIYETIATGQFDTLGGEGEKYKNMAINR